MAVGNNSPLSNAKALQRWHRRIGLAGAVFFVVLIATGLLLNHSDGLRLDARYVRAPLLLDLYHISPPRASIHFAAGGHLVSQLGTRLYLDARELPEKAEQLVGAIESHDTLVIAIAGKLLLLSPEGKLIERLDGADGVPAGMRRLGRSGTGQALVLQAAHGYYTADLARLHWNPSDATDVAWADPVQVPPDVEERLLDAYRGTGLPFERVILDIHSGRILGEWGVYLVDGAAALFLTLVATGLWMWIRQR